MWHVVAETTFVGNSYIVLPGTPDKTIAEGMVDLLKMYPEVIDDSIRVIWDDDPRGEDVRYTLTDDRRILKFPTDHPDRAA